jgi:translocation and assembly module TamB
MEGTFRFEGYGLDPNETSGSLVLPRVSLSVGEYQVENEGTVNLSIDDGRIAIRSLTLAGPETKLTVSGSSGFGSDLAVTFLGDVNLSLLRSLSRAVEHADGSALIRIMLRDDWASPDMTGEVVLRNGLIKIRDIPQRFTRLNGTVSFDRSRIASEGISGEVGGGTLSASGSAQFKGTALEEFSTKAVVENVTVRYPPGLDALLGGILYYDGNSASQILSGEVKIGRARYERRVDWKSMLVDFGKKFMPQKKTELGWIGETQLNVRFTGKENIVFESNLAKVPIEIDMLFRGTVNKAQVLGRIEARKGDVYFRNNVFHILRASADFADPNRINPLLDVQAETRVREYNIRLGVTGHADRAEVTFLSDPSLSDADILALLTIGRRGEELKGKEAEIGRSEATAFATGMFQDFLESRTGSIIGLDRFQVDPYINKYDTAVPRVTVGKEVVQDKIFMSYSSNIAGATPEQNIRLEYILNRNISVLGEYDELGQIGADVKFRFEFR